MVTINQIEVGAVRYIDAEIAPKIPVNVPNGQLKKIAFLAGAAYAVRKNVQQYASHPMLTQIGAVDEAGMWIWMGFWKRPGVRPRRTDSRSPSQFWGI